jgi:CheY-like chemotaxis protein
MYSLLPVRGQVIRRILVMDDYEDFRLLIKDAIEDFVGWYVYAVELGDEGLQIARNESWDIILLDVAEPSIKPGMNGFQIYEHLRADPKTQQIPLILMTTMRFPSNLRRLKALQATDIIQKPFDFLSLIQRINAALES